MTQHDDSMRLHHILRSNHSKTLPKPLGLMEHRAPLSASGSPTTCNNRQRRRKQPVAQVTMRSNCTTSHKVCSTQQAQTYPRAKCNNTDKNTNRKNRANSRNNTNSTELVSCMVCNSKVNSLRKQPMTKFPPSDNNGLAPRLRHCPRNSGSHKQHNTTLQDKAFPLAHHLRSSRRLKSLRNTRSRLHTHNPVLQHISNPTQCLTLRSRRRTRRTASNRNILHQRNRSNLQNRSIRLSVDTRHRSGRFSRELGREIYVTCRNSCSRSRSTYWVAPRGLVSDFQR